MSPAENEKATYPLYKKTQHIGIYHAAPQLLDLRAVSHPVLKSGAPPQKNGRSTRHVGASQTPSK